MSYEQIHKPQARQRYYKGETIYLLPSKVSTESMWVKPYPISFSEFDKDFDKLCNSFEYYNCNSELGNYIHFFVEVKENG